MALWSWWLGAAVLRPLKQFLKRHWQKNTKREAWLFFGVRTKQDLYGEQWIQDIDQSNGKHLFITRLCCRLNQKTVTGMAQEVSWQNICVHCLVIFQMQRVIYVVHHWWSMQPFTNSRNVACRWITFFMISFWIPVIWLKQKSKAAFNFLLGKRRSAQASAKLLPCQLL